VALRVQMALGKFVSVNKKQNFQSLEKSGNVLTN
jgi:hypothetical protein